MDQQPKVAKEDHTAYYANLKEYFEEHARQRPSAVHPVKQLMDHATIWTPLFSLLEPLMNHDSTIQSLAEIGCGTGTLLKTIAHRFPAYHEILGVDFSFDILKIGRQHTDSETPISYLNADLLHLPFPSQSIDVTLCVNVLHHIHPNDLHQAYSELQRITKKYLLIEIRNTHTIYNFGYLPMIQKMFYKNVPITTLSPRQMSFFIFSNQFSYLRVRGIVPLPWFCRSLDIFI